MKRSQKREMSPVDIAEAEARYLETKDPIYVVLAIGSSPIEPPFWAMEAATALVRDVRGNASIGNERKLRGSRLDAMIREYFRLFDIADRADGYSPPALRSVIETVLSAEGITRDDPIYDGLAKGLERAWKCEAEGFDLDPHGVPENGRQKRMILEWGDLEYGAPRAEFALDHLWKLERLFARAARNEKK